MTWTVVAAGHLGALTLPTRRTPNSAGCTPPQPNFQRSADNRYPDAAERQAKLLLAYALNQVLEDRQLSQADAAKVLGVTQPKVSALRHYKLAGFSVERLMNLLTALDRDVEIVIRRKPRSRKAGRISVVAA